MARTWVIGDIHGCAAEFDDLLGSLELAEGDRVLSIGDLFHRGPDPAGVWKLACGLDQFEAILGNHEHAMIGRATRSDGVDLRGDGGSTLAPLEPAVSAGIVRAVTGFPLYLEGMTASGAWQMVHAALPPGRHPSECEAEELVRLRELRDLPSSPFWFQVYDAEPLVLFGHKPFRRPYLRMRGERPAVIGLDTGCVYGGRLTAYCLEDDRFVCAAARANYRV